MLFRSARRRSVADLGELSDRLLDHSEGALAWLLLDLAVEVDGDEQMLVIIEIKGTDWDAIPAGRVMRDLSRPSRKPSASQGRNTRPALTRLAGGRCPTADGRQATSRPQPQQGANREGSQGGLLRARFRVRRCHL